MPLTDHAVSLPDQSQRDQILGAAPEDLGRSFAVEAGAGSGKTTALIGRLLALVEAGEEHLPGGLREVVAITFTRKAAAELRAQAYRRFVARAAGLAAALDEPGPEADPEDLAVRLRRVREALAELDAACIDTIHGFCGRLLRADALAVGLPPDFAVIEDREADDLRRAFWRGYVRERHERTEGEIAGVPASLDDVGLSPAQVEPLFAALIRHADRLPAPYGAECPDLGPAVAKGVEKLEAWQALRPDPPLGPRDGLQRALDTAERLLHMRGLDTPLDRARFLGALMEGYKESGDKGDVTLNRWAERGSPGYAEAKALRDEGVPALAAGVLPVLRAWEAYVYDAALAYARGAVEACAAERRREGTLTFDDVLQATADLLRQSPAARRRAAARYRRFFVDEFQDTDPVQAEVLFLLAADNLDETDWRRCRPRPGSLFLVGDPKQSIYRFRRADIETYDEARRMLGEEAQLQLTSCFRSLPQVCDWVNGRLRTPFSEDRQTDGGTRRQAAYVDLQSARPDGPLNRDPAPAVARIDIEKVYGNYAEPIAEADAEAVAAFIRTAVDGRADPALYEQAGDRARPEAFGGDKGTVFGPEARYGDFLVLCRAASRFSTYAAAFERLGIPYALAGDKGLGNADELRALVDLLDAVRDPLDGVALAAHRTGLLGGLDAPTLFGLHVETLDGDEARARAAEVADAVVARARHALETLPLASAIERIVTESGLLAWSARRPGGSDRAGGLLKLVALARGWEAEGLHWTEALEHLRDLLDGEAKDGRITLEEGTRHAVRIMTVHQAKGLQAPVVFLADPYSGHDPKPSDHAGRDEGGRSYATVPLIRPYAHGGFSLVAAPRCWHERDAEEAALYDAAEDRRIVYVATTRARGLLVVSRYLPKEGAGTWGLLDAGLGDAPPLEELLAGPPDPLPRPRYPLDSGRERRCAALARASRPSFVARAVSENTREGRAPAAYEGTDEAGYGSAYGTAVHQLFEWAVRSRGDGPQPAAERALVERLWAEHDVQTPVAYALEALAALRASELWRRVLSADEVHAEVPVAGPFPTAAVGGDGSAPTEPVIWRGTVDLAYRDDAGWHLVDYKTDGDAVAEALADCAARHAEQLAVYAALWEAATGAAPATRSLWFTASGVLCAV